MYKILPELTTFDKKLPMLVTGWQVQKMESCLSDSRHYCQNCPQAAREMHYGNLTDRETSMSQLLS